MRAVDVEPRVATRSNLRDLIKRIDGSRRCRACCRHDRGRQHALLRVLLEGALESVDAHAGTIVDWDLSEGPDAHSQDVHCPVDHDVGLLGSVNRNGRSRHALVPDRWSNASIARSLQSYEVRQRTARGEEAKSSFW